MEGDSAVKTEVETTAGVASEDVRTTVGSLGTTATTTCERTKLRRAKHDQPWNKYNRNTVGPKAPPVVSRPTKEEALRRRKWEEDRRTYQECQAKLRALNKERQARKIKIGGDEAATARRQVILERSRRWQEKHERFSKERQMGNEQFRRLKERHEKLLHERFEENFTKTIKTVEMEKRRQYHERLGRFRNLRPKDIIEADALSKFRQEVGNVSEMSLRSQSTPGQRGPRSKKNARSRSTVPVRPPAGHISNTGTGAGAGVAPLPNDQPLEEPGLKKTLDRDSKQKQRLEAPAEVVEETDVAPNTVKEPTEDVAQEVSEDTTTEES